MCGCCRKGCEPSWSESKPRMLETQLLHGSFGSHLGSECNTEGQMRIVFGMDSCKKPKGAERLASVICGDDPAHGEVGMENHQGLSK